ncbi:globin domain-containing protein [Ferviditalea candida]|uniref:Globin n=1 Tax=Ferviditalea candida TaxID=3108399 RepID=A0ABU5ZJB6_9BACL|nr:globin [Paenibacillaceae bacterium T2]
MERQTERTIYEVMGGEEMIRSIVETFYPKVIKDPVIGPLFPEDIHPVKEKQFLFLTQFFGGPPLYTVSYGHPMMRARHLQVPIGMKEAEAWISCMRQTLEEIGMEPALRDFILERLKGPAFHFINKDEA